MRFSDYEQLIANGEQAEARVRGILRGGHVVGDEFVAHAGGHGIIREPLNNVTDLRMATEYQRDKD